MPWLADASRSRTAACACARADTPVPTRHGSMTGQLRWPNAAARRGSWPGSRLNALGGPISPRDPMPAAPSGIPTLLITARPSASTWRSTAVRMGREAGCPRSWTPGSPLLREGLPPRGSQSATTAISGSMRSPPAAGFSSAFPRGRFSAGRGRSPFLSSSLATPTISRSWGRTGRGSRRFSRICAA